MSFAVWLRVAVVATMIVFASPQSGDAANCDNIKSGFDAKNKPQNTAPTIVGQSLDEIIERGYIQFAVYDDFPPYSWKEKGKKKGTDIELGQLIAKELGVKAQFYFTLAGENIDADLRNNVWKGALIGGSVSNVMMRVPYNKELACRNEQVVLTGQYANENISIAYRKDVYPEDAPVPAYFRFDEVGVENDSIADFYLSGLAGGQIIPKMTRYKNVEEAMAALKKGEVKAVMGPIGQLEFGKDDNIEIHTPPLPGLAVGKWTLGVAVRQSWRPLAYAVDDAIRKAAQDGSLKTIFANYGLTWLPPKW